MARGLWNGAAYESLNIGVPTMSSSASTSITTSGVTASTNSTAPNTTDSVTGVMLFFIATPTLGNITVELMESGVSKATATLNNADIQLGFNYARFATPYTFTTTASNAYTIRLTNTSANTGSVRNAGTGGIWYQLSTDATLSPTVGDDVWVVGFQDAGLSTKTLTFTGTSTSFGSGTDKAFTQTTVSSMGAGLTIGNGGTVAWDTTADTTVQLRGTILITRNGTLQIDGNASDIEIVSRLIIDCDVANADYEIITAAGSYGGRILMRGKEVSAKAQYASGVGTAANPIVTQAAHGFTVNDEIVIPGTSYNTNQVKYVISIPSSTQLVVADTVGGAESAITNSPVAGVYIGNMTRNVVIQALTNTRGWSIFNAGTQEQSEFTDARFEYATCTSGFGLQFESSSAAFPTIVDRCVGYQNSAAGRTSWSFSSNLAQTYTDNILYNTRGTNFFAQSGFVITSSNKTVNGLYHYAEPSSTTNCAAFSLSAAATNNLIQNVHSYGANAGNSSIGYAIGVFGSGNTFRNCTVNGSRVQGIILNSGQGNEFYGMDMGSVGNNTIDIKVDSDVFVQALFSDSTFSSTTLLSNYQNALEGSEIRFHQMDSNNNKHRWYRRLGSAWSSGSGLTDTTVRTSGSLALVMKPEDATSGMFWEFKIPAVPNTRCGVFGYGYRNATFSSGTFKVELYLPGSTTPDDTFTFSTTTEAWQLFSVGALYSGTESRYAKVRITAITNTAGAYAFIDDIYDAGTSNKVAGLDLWDEGKPSEIMVVTDFVSSIPQIVNGVWSDNDTYNAGEKGKVLADTEANTDLTQAKVDQL